MTNTAPRPATSNAIERVHRVVDADGPLAADDVAALVAALRRAAAGHGSIESNLGLAPGWRKVIAARRRDAALNSLPRGAGSGRAVAAQLRRDLARYSRRRYAADRDRGAAADPADEPFFTILSAHRGRVVSLSTVRRLAWLKSADAMSQRTSDDLGMAKPKHAPVDPAEMSAEELDDFIAGVRLPELRDERAALTRKLVAISASIGFQIDWEWQPKPTTANDPAVILTGRTAPAEETMPAPALHAALLRRRDAVDKAIEIAQRAAQRVADRRLEERIAANWPEIRDVARERALLALQLQRATRHLLEIERRLGVEPRFGLPSSGADLLGPGWADDEVAVLVDGLLVSGILSRKDVKNAAE